MEIQKAWHAHLPLAAQSARKSATRAQPSASDPGRGRPRPASRQQLRLKLRCLQPFGPDDVVSALPGNRSDNVREVLVEAIGAR